MHRRFIAIIGLLLTMALFATSAVFAAGYSFSGNITSGAQYDLYTVGLVAGEGVTATLVCDFDGTSRPLDPVLTVFFPGTDSSDTFNAEVYNDDGFGSDDDPLGVDCDAFDSSRVIFSAPVTGDYTFRADGFGSSTGPYTLSIHTSPPGGFYSGDSRINQDAAARVAIFCADGGVEVMLVASSTSLTALFSATATQVADAAAGTVIATGGGVELSKTGDGSLQVQSPDSDGKAYLFVWSGCPVTWTTTYSIDPVTGVTRTTGTGGH